MPRMTKAQRTEADLAEAEDAIRSLNSSLTYVRTEREKAREERDMAQTLVAGMDANLRQQRQHIRRLFNSIFHLNLDVARKAGYIDRVREGDPPRAHHHQPGDQFITSTASDDPDIGDLRDRLASARGDKQVANVIDGMPSDILDQVLGREDNGGITET